MTSSLLQNRQLPWPTNWNEIFGRSAPLIIEIGFGSGHFLVDLAQKRPSANVMGVEISLPSLEKAQRKVKTLGVQNVRLLQSDARYLLQALCQPESISEVYINFPDPWPKAKQLHRRLINVDFLHLLATRLVPGGLLDVATDHADYALAITEALEGTPYFESRLPTTFVTEDNERLRTKYEQIGLDEGRTCHYYKFARCETAVPQSYPILKEFPMPHAVLQSPLQLDEIQARYGRWQYSHNDCHINFMELFRARDDEALFVEAYIKEAPVAQRLGLVIRQREPGNYVINLHELGFPRPTRGVQLAIGQLATWLVSLHSETEILHHNLLPDALEPMRHAA
ncbi:tRNA (guanosine(46)-N7)-methyltransferase TrmB [Candidatus Leptofilum sp.]|uniref:tRNA (guanosine(46)-N7)-methyltransferase TrmB n=1 Tax=Candidatus Leptofilum sp. TaxID=3241576 RepID=UPI003B5B804A